MHPRYFFAETLGSAERSATYTPSIHFAAGLDWMEPQSGSCGNREAPPHRGLDDSIRAWTRSMYCRKSFNLLGHQLVLVTTTRHAHEPTNQGRSRRRGRIKLSQGGYTRRDGLVTIRINNLKHKIALVTYAPHAC